MSISALDLEHSTRFYEELLGMERIATPTFSVPVQWLRVGELQLHLFLSDEPGPRRHHVGITVDDFDEAYRRLRERGDAEFGSELVELPSGQIQLYFRDPAGNLIELNGADAATLDRSRYPELRRLADSVPQREGAEQAVLYLHPRTSIPG